MFKTKSNPLKAEQKARVFKFFMIFYALLFMLYAFGQNPTLAQESSVAGQKTDDASSAVREKVRQQIENMVKKPKAVIGSLNQITDSTLVIKTMSEKTVQVATSAETKYARFTKGKKSDIKFEDLTLGEFSVAMGFRNGNEIVEAKRVLVYDASPFVKKQVLNGRVTEFAKNKITLERTGNNEKWTVILSSTTGIVRKSLSKGMEEIDSSDIEIGDNIIAAGSLDEKTNMTLLAGGIFIRSMPKSSPSPNPQPLPKKSSTL